MKSNRRKIQAKFDADEKRKLLATGIVSVNGIKAKISEKGLVESSRMLNDVRPVVEGHSVAFGTTLDDPNYPLFLNAGFQHAGSGQTVGPHRFMEEGQAETEDDVRRIWRIPIK